MIDLLLQAMFIGILSSAPMGPVGMLCIQRTLTDGRRSGLITGFGAAVGDFAYAFVAMIGALGLSLINEYIEKHQSILQIVGSIVLILFGVILYKQNPARNITKMQKKELPFGKLFGSALLLTLSNVGVLFLYMALFTRFPLFNHNYPFIFSVIQIFSLGIGAFCWWLLITYIVNKFRHKLNPRGLIAFNRLIAIIIVAIGIFGVISGAYFIWEANTI